MAGLVNSNHLAHARALNRRASHNEGEKMRKILTALAALLLALSIPAVAAAQDNSANPTAPSSRSKTAGPAKKRGPVFRATIEQIKQAQAILKQRGFFTGEGSGKLDTETRTGLRRYQEAEGIKVTGTLNRLTLVKMNIALTDRQKTMPA
jgi:peptidoglycan hydrolase-like protein with peptidoglycan-binding domain